MLDCLYDKALPIRLRLIGLLPPLRIGSAFHVTKRLIEGSRHKPERSETMNYDFYQYRRLSMRQPLSMPESDLLLDLLSTSGEASLAPPCLMLLGSDAQRTYRQGPGKRASVVRLLEIMRDEWPEGAEKLSENLSASADEEVMFVVVKGDATTYMVYTDPSLAVLHGITRHSDNDGGSTGFGVIAGNDVPPPTPLRSAARQWPRDARGDR